MDNLLDTIRDAWRELDLSPTAQDFILFAGFFLVLWIVRQVVVRRLGNWLRSLARRTVTNYDDAMIDRLDRPMRFLMLGGLVLFASILIEPSDEAMNRFVYPLVYSLISIGVFFLLLEIVRFFTADEARFERITSSSVDDKLLPFVRTGLQILLIALLIVILLSQWGYDVNGLIAGLGIGGLAVALAAQDTLANLFGFTTIVGDQPFVVGDYIKTPDVEGLVEHVGIRSSQIRQLDQATVTVPNSMLASAPVLNWSRLSKRRYNSIIGVTYDATAQQMESLLAQLREMLREREFIETDSVVVYFINFGDSALEILVRCYVRKSDWGEFTAEREAINLAIMRIVEQMGMNMAFPSRSIYIENIPPTLKDLAEELPAQISPPPTPTPTDETPPIPHGDTDNGENYDEQDDADVKS